MAKDFVLIATLGDSDIQVVYESARLPRPRRLRLRRQHERAFHQACLDQRIRYSMLRLDDCLEPKVEKFYEKDYLYDPRANVLTTPISDEDLDDYRIACDSQTVRLCAPLLAELTDEVKRLQQAGRLGQLRSALLLTTCRDQGRFREQEAIAAAMLARAPLAEAFQIAESEIQECVFLRATEQLYAVDRQNQRHLSVIAARRIDEAIRNLARTHGDCRAVLSDIAGLPETKPILAAACRYRFGGGLLFVRRPEESERGVPPTTVIVPPAESLATRAQVATLVKRGAFDAAAVVARNDEYARAEPWRWRLRELASVLNGAELDEPQPRLWEPQPSSMQRVSEQLRNANGSLIVAFRVESAVRRADWPTAILATVTFAEAVCDDVLGQRRKFRLDELPKPEREPLEAFAEAARALQPYRNLAAHHVLGSADVEAARRIAVENGLWSKSPPHFLGQGQVQKVFKLLGVDDPNMRYDEVIQAVLGDLDTFSFQDGPTEEA